MLERSIQQGFEKFSEVLSQEFRFLRSEISKAFSSIRSEIAAVRNELRVDIAESRADFQSGLRDQLMKILGIVVAVVSLAVVIIKIFPNAG